MRTLVGCQPGLSAFGILKKVNRRSKDRSGHLGHLPRAPGQCSAWALLLGISPEYSPAMSTRREASLWQGTSLEAQMVKHLPTTQETRVQSLGPEDLLEKEMATNSSTLA